MSDHVNPTFEPPPMTTWSNPTDRPQRVTFQTSEVKLVGRGLDPETGNVVNIYSPATYETYEVPPGGTADIPSLYDNGIHCVRDGLIIGGMAPLLIKKDQAYGIDPACIPAPETARPKGGVTPAELVARLRAQAAPASSDAMTRARVKRDAAR